MSRKEFDAIWNVHGWTIHAAMLTAHARYSQLFNSEFVVRNKLTEKHKELIRLVGEGLMDKQIAHELDISFSAVRQRLIAVQKKIGVQNRSDLVAVAARLLVWHHRRGRPQTKDMAALGRRRRDDRQCRRGEWK